MSVFFNRVKNEIDNYSFVTKLTSQEHKSLMTKNSLLPMEYLDFLKEVGYGDLNFIQIYGGTITADDVYPIEVAKKLTDFLLIGDDGQGYCFAFNIKDNYNVVEIDPTGEVDFDMGGGFNSFIETFL